MPYESFGGVAYDSTCIAANPNSFVKGRRGVEARTYTCPVVVVQSHLHDRIRIHILLTTAAKRCDCYISASPRLFGYTRMILSTGRMSKAVKGKYLLSVVHN